MCWKAPKPAAPPPPPPLPAAAGPPPSAPKPPPTAELLRPSGTNAAVRQARTKKAKDPSLRGTGALRIPLTTGVNSTGTAPSGGVNTGGTP
jgi:hypothetical protein